MSIVLAGNQDLETIKSITIHTIKSVYPLYYPKGAVDFFISHHHDEAISKDIQSGFVYIKLNPEKYAVGTVTIRENEICRLFVLPQYQKQGFGRELLAFAENKIARQYETGILDASLPAKPIYLKRGYVVTQSHSIQTQSGDFLCYDVMRRDLNF